MKRISILSLLLIALISFNSCKTEDDVVFQAGDSEINFTNAFLNDYILTPETAGNIAERFTWQTPDVGTPANLTYTLEASIGSDFATSEIAGTTSGNEIAVTVGQMLAFWNQLNLDTDPETEDISNSGQFYFRVKYVVGNEGLENMSSVQALTLSRLEDTGETNTAICELDTLYAVGAGLPTAGWSWDTPVAIACTGEGVYSANVDFTADGDAIDGDFDLDSTFTNSLNIIENTDQLIRGSFKASFVVSLDPSDSYHSAFINGVIVDIPSFRIAK